MKRYAAWALIVCLFLSVPHQAQELTFDPKLLDTFTAHCIGPANMSGRICEVAVVESNPATMYLAFATGGVFKTTDNGNTWKPLFDDQPNSSIGAIAVAPSDPKIVWVGTGEANPRNSVSWGNGVYLSTDAGGTWKNMGLRDTHHIGRVIIHPTNPNIVYVAALGHIWGANKQRGIFKTSDGGKTWQHALVLDENTGCIDVAMDPSESDVLYAAAYCVHRDTFSAGNPITQTGPRAGLYRTEDGARTWSRMSAGLPKGLYGRCGLSVYRKNPNVVYAVVQTSKTITGNTAKQVPGQGPNLNTTIEDGGVFRSNDKGKTWIYVNSLCPRPFYYGQIRIDPNDDNRIYVLGVPFYLSVNGGKKFAPVTMKNVHVDHHALWINPKNSKHLVLGNDGGLYFSKNAAGSWEHIRGFAVGQFYAIGVDMRKPYRVYGGLQDNGSWGGPSATRSDEGITLNDWKKVGGGDGFHCQVDPTDANTVYWEMQYGKPSRYDVTKGTSKNIAPKVGTSGDTYRFNWSSPMVLSPHDPRTLFYGGQFVFRSEDRGDTWKKISSDLTRAPAKFTGHGHTLFTIAESPKKAGVIYAGSDDGRLHVTRDGGGTWDDVSQNILPMAQDRCISRVECSYHDTATAYVTISRHRNDDRGPYVFKTTDFGATWKSIVSNLPEGSVHVIRESSRNKDLLFVGTEFALYASLDGGTKWQRLMNGLPTVPMHDLVIHPRERDLVIGTHGRSIYAMNIGPLEEMSAKVLAANAHLFDVRPAQAYVSKAADPASKSKAYVAANPPVGAEIYFYAKQAAEKSSLTITDKGGKMVASVPVPKTAGLHKVLWNLRTDADKTLVEPGEYAARLDVGGTMLTKPIRVEAVE